MLQENSRQKAVENLREIEVMNSYLVPKDNIEIRDIKVWGELNENYTVDDVDRIRKEHLEKLDRYRQRKDWEAWVEEDELDLEGERVLAEIKNYKSEYFFNTGVI
jgi:hypothetical protein